MNYQPSNQPINSQALAVDDTERRAAGAHGKRTTPAHYVPGAY